MFVTAVKAQRIVRHEKKTENRKKEEAGAVADLREKTQATYDINGQKIMNRRKY
jgi:hypothetical protein